MKNKIINISIQRPIRDFYKIIIGPSSSHTYGVYKIGIAIRNLLEQNPTLFTHFKIEFFNSMSGTGIGHKSYQAITGGLLDLPLKDMTSFINNFDKANYPQTIFENKDITFNPSEDIIWNKEYDNSLHPNTIKLFVYNGEQLLSENTYESVGGGVITPDLSKTAYQSLPNNIQYHNFTTFAQQAMAYEGTLLDFVLTREEMLTGNSRLNLVNEMAEKYSVMMDGVEDGSTLYEGDLEGITVHRAKKLFKHTLSELKRDGSLYTYADLAYAAAIAHGENAAKSGLLISAPTSGGGSVLPGTLYALQYMNVSPIKLIHSLYIAGVVGQIIEHNATLSGAEGGCTFEIGVGTAMASAANIYVRSEDTIDHKPKLLSDIHQAITSVFTHFSQMPCDCIGGMVIHPCIERNAEMTLHALHGANTTLVPNPSHNQKVIDFDEMVNVAYQLGKALPNSLRETGIGGAAEAYRKTPKE